MSFQELSQASTWVGLVKWLNDSWNQTSIHASVVDIDPINNISGNLLESESHYGKLEE